MINKNKKIIIIFILLSISPFFLTFFQCKTDELKFQQFTSVDAQFEQNTIAYENFNYYYKLWKQSNIHNYHFLVRYIANSQTAGIWEIWVKEDKVVKIITNKKEVIEKEKINKKLPFYNFTIETLFMIASYSYKLDKDSIYKIVVEYDKNFGHPIKVKKLPSINNPPKDLGFAYFVTFFEILEMNQ